MFVRAKQNWFRRTAFAGAVLASAVITLGATPQPAAAQYYPAAYPGYAYTYYPYYPYYRIASGQPLQKQAFVYQDPVTGNTLVTGTLTITLTDPGLTMSYINSTNLNMRKTNATVSYTFRNRNYTVSLDSMRTADQ